MTNCEFCDGVMELGASRCSNCGAATSISPEAASTPSVVHHHHHFSGPQQGGVSPKASKKTHKEKVQILETRHFENGRPWVLWVLACIPCMNLVALMISAQVFFGTKSSVVKKQAAQVFGFSFITVVIWITAAQFQETQTSKPKPNNTSNYSPPSPSPPSYSNYNATKKWYEGGTLHSVQVTTWRTGSYRNKLATSADWCAVEDPTVSFETLKKRASQVLYCVEDAVSGGDADHMQISEIATACIIILRENW